MREIPDGLAVVVRVQYDRQSVDGGFRDFHVDFAAAGLGLGGHDYGLHVFHGEHGSATVLGAGRVIQVPPGGTPEIERREEEHHFGYVPVHREVGHLLDFVGALQIVQQSFGDFRLRAINFFFTITSVIFF